MVSEPIELYGGQMIFPCLTPALSEKEYAILKIQCWLELLNDSSKPNRWLNSNKKGTAVNFRIIKTREEWDNAFDALKDFVSDVNKKFGLDIILEKDEKILKECQ